jgi:hypothetical protein
MLDREILIRYVREALRGRAENVVDFFALPVADQRARLEVWADKQIELADAEAQTVADKRAEIAAWRAG